MFVLFDSQLVSHTPGFVSNWAKLSLVNDYNPRSNSVIIIQRILQTFLHLVLVFSTMFQLELSPIFFRCNRSWSCPMNTEKCICWNFIWPTKTKSSIVWIILWIIMTFLKTIDYISLSLLSFFYYTLSAKLRVHWMYSLQRGKIHPSKKEDSWIWHKIAFDGEAPFLDIRGVGNTPSLLLLPIPLWPEVVIPVYSPIYESNRSV